ncbi:hypothetical protein DEO45_01780 [Rhodanobacter denitrificans]|uniref:OmpR/PhoB-type domain-containing protein n=1 Tax=Rhodanobacter denitrificans TaxID=666685 RepID=A0A368KHM6_9GAMM|nr:winged helix-turn-helix domain-containing protein [Rhodanobacter denitrificans]RCS31429.1 hypothetical protein DEO45_01780 [Rhodanobacter denitrificans]
MSVATRSPRFRLGEWLVVPQECRLYGTGGSRTIEPKLMDVLAFLCERATEVVSAEELLIALWGGVFYGDNPVHKSIAQLRRALGDSATEPHYIATIRKRGYRIVSEVLFMQNYAPVPASVAMWTKGSPYPGLAAFDADRQAVFYGRSQAQAAVLSRLQSRLAEKRGFVVILGPSGSGKTSLLQAGVIPLLTQAHGFSGTHVLSVARIEPTHIVADPCATLAAAMLQWRAGNEPLFHETEKAWLATSLAEDIQCLLASMEDRLQRRAGFRASEDQAPIFLLVLDQMERAFTQQGDTISALDEFFTKISDLLATGRVAMLTTCRNDFYPNLVHIPALVELKAEDGQFDLAPLSPGEVAQIIRIPAQAAGLCFEQDRETDLRLDDMLRDAAASSSQSLPLLQHTLSVLYEKRTTSGMLTFTAYREIGGLAGSLAQHAENAFAQLAEASQRCLPELLRKMVSIDEDDRSPVSQPVPSSQIDDPNADILVRKFVDERLFASTLVGDIAAIAVAHESLLGHWPRIQQWIEENQRLLIVRARVAQAQRRWSSENESRDFLLPAGHQLHDALQVALHSKLSLAVDQRRFIERSLRRANRQRYARNVAFSAIVLLGLATGVAGIVAMIQRRAAVEQRLQAESLVGFMLGKLTDSLRPIGKLDVLDSVGNEAMRYLASVPQESSDLPVELLRARAYRQIGEIRLARGDNRGAAESFGRAADLSQSIVQAHPNNVDAWFDYGNAVFWIGQLAYNRSDFAGASWNFGRYLRAATEQVKLRPDDERSLIELSYAHSNLAVLNFRLGRYKQALAGFNASLELKRHVHSVNTGNLGILMDIGNTLTWLGNVDEAQGDLSGAEHRHEQALQVMEDICRANPENQQYRYKLAIARMHVASVALDRGEVDISATEYRNAYEELLSLRQIDPKNAEWRRESITAGLEFGLVESFRGRRQEARDLVTANAKAVADLARGNPAAPESILLHALALTQQLRIGSSPVSETSLSGEISALRHLLEKTPANLSARNWLAEMLLLRASCGHCDSAPGASSYANEAIAILSKLDRSSSKARFYGQQVKAYLLAGDKTEALEIIGKLSSFGYLHPAYIQLLRSFRLEQTDGQSKDRQEQK